jgi:RNA polymerase sigma-70 factor (ECF subfamily)
VHDAKVITTNGAAPSERDALSVDAESFEALYLEHHLAIYRYLRGWGSADEVAADLTAETFERAYRNLDRYRPGEGGPLTWLFRIARNLAIDAARRRETARRGLRFWPREKAAPDPAEIVLQDEAERLLARRVAALPPAQREAIVLRYTGGLSAREIGVVLGRSEAAAHKLMNRALVALKEAYRDDT